jgi:hypothetical protein
MLGGAGRRKLRALVLSGAFNCYRHGGRTLYSANEVQSYIRTIKAAGPSRAPWRGRGKDVDVA